MGIILMQSIEVVNDICAEYLSAAEVFKRKHIFFICGRSVVFCAALNLVG